MAKEIPSPIGYLDQEMQQDAKDWAEGILPLLKKYPQLNDIDCVIEGGKGNGRITAHVAKILFPQALYVGTDLSPSLNRALHLKRLHEAIDPISLQNIMAANKNPSYEMQGATISGSCFDGPLIMDILKKTGRNHPLLITKNALSAILGREVDPGERKKDEDKIGLDTLINNPNLYEAQIHIGIFWDDTPAGTDNVSDRFYWLENAAVSQDKWITEKFDCGLFLLQKKPLFQTSK